MNMAHAMMKTGRLTDKDFSISIDLLKYLTKNREITVAATKKATSQMRRCQKRVNVTGLIVPPTYISLVDIMTIMVYFYKCWEVIKIMLFF